MADLVIPEGFASVSLRLQHSLVARSAFVTFGIALEGLGTDLSEYADSVEGVWATAMAARIDSNVTMGPVTVTVQLPDGSYGSVTGALTDPGSASSASPSPNVAVTCRKVTSRLGRRGRGRMSLPWACDESGVDEAGTIEPAVVTAVTDALDALLVGLEGVGAPMVLLHTAGPSGSTDPDVVTGWTVNNYVGTQRRRMRRS